MTHTKDSEKGSFFCELSPTVARSGGRPDKLLWSAYRHAVHHLLDGGVLEGFAVLPQHVLRVLHLGPHFRQEALEVFHFPLRPPDGVVVQAPRPLLPLAFFYQPA